MAKKNRSQVGVVDCACLIHSTAYDWIYVERLYNMLTRHLPNGIRFHVYTEHDRSVPPYMIKHCLQEWPNVKGPKKSWWYKIQMFNTEHHDGNLLYFDLDTMIVDDLSWITALSTDYFWTLRDFRYLQRDTWNSMNSSVMWWNVPRYAWVWEKFEKQGYQQVIQSWPGDQDFINATIDHTKKRYLPIEKFQSWRWQCWDGGMNFQTRKPKLPGTGTQIAPNVCAVVFHGHPKPHEIRNDPIIENFWK